MKILVPHTIALDLTPGAAPAGRDGPPRPDEVVLYDASAPLPAEHRDAEVLVAWANSRENLADAATHLSRLRWVQTLAAGPDAILAAGFAPEVVVTNGRSLHDGPVAEHALALTLAAVRDLDRLGAAQREHCWDALMPDLQADPATSRHFTLHGARVTIWGFGSIAARLAPLYAALGAHVTGVASSAGERHGFPVVTDADLPRVLATTDVLVSLLPAVPATRHAFDAARIDALPDHAVFVNVGRGATVDEEALVVALREGRLGCAALDVTETEPLPSDSPLWDAPRTIITPHVAGGRPQGASELVRENLANLRAGRPLRNVVLRG
ncbi:phosphoglycerate dehydrogenase [Oerskovia turbata]|uniref:Phosphoglycerate dehydrogenase n=1 Tax=Oerskovia turbata TaxID=1713 RepID=A0A4Q1L2H8_9CELL|nr:phosphoglycerate dehydrogenase [Oerskovia turbata]RXR28037.1 phosphoglycerate dehydrogenase [Oerskovia turbata]RXR35954.1 phosphoglycerate dehydrogenase [Oerskovia turbata]